MWDHLGKEYGIIQRVNSFFKENIIEWHSAQHDFLAFWVVHAHLTQETQMLPSALQFGHFWPVRLQFLFQVLGLLSLPMHFMGIVLHVLFVALPFEHWALVSDVLCSHASKHPTNVTCSYHPIVHFMGVGESSPCFHLFWGTRDRRIWAPCQQRFQGAWNHSPSEGPSGLAWCRSCFTCIASNSDHEIDRVTAWKPSSTHWCQPYASRGRCFPCWWLPWSVIAGWCRPSSHSLWRSWGPYPEQYPTLS